ncbi:hypothetical protein MRX96_034878 [Rhipicephalus microplus]
MEAFQEIRQVGKRARGIWPPVPGSHSDAETSDHLLSSLMAVACKNLSQQILDDVRTAYRTPGLVECSDGLPHDSNGG